MSSKTWESYEEVAAYLLDRNAKEFGLEKVEGKQSIRGQRSGTDWEIDAKGIKENGEGFIIIECRRYTKSKQNQEKLGSLAYRIIDTDASGGIIVSPLGLQSGAQKVAKAENILNVQLDSNSTPTEFALKFLNKLMIGLSETVVLSDKVTVVVTRICKQCGKKFEDNGNNKLCPVCSD